MGFEFEAIAGVTQTDLGLSREIHGQIGGNPEEIGARLFEGRGRAALEEMEIGVLTTSSASWRPTRRRAKPFNSVAFA